MHFLAPTAFIFAAALPVVVLFYLLKRKRVVRLVSSTLLWQKFLAETQASSPFQKLRHNWLLILQLLLLTLIILALTRPYFSSTTTTGRLQVAILDASASMQSRDETPSRFEKARAEALAAVNAMQDTDRMVVLQCAAGVEVKQSATSDKSALRRALQSAQVTDGPTRLTEALKLAETLIRDQPGAEIHLYSDGAAPALTDFENKGLPLIYHRLGTGANNAGIVSMDVRVHPEDPAQRAVFIGVANYSTNKLTAELELRFDNELLGVKPLQLAPRETSPQVFTAPQTREGVFTAKLNLSDDLAADNQASLVSLLPQPIKVLLLSKGNRFLEKALRAAPNVLLSASREMTEPTQGYDVVVLDDVIPAAWPTANLLAFHVAQTNWFDGWSKIETPPIVDWRNTHALLRFVNFDNVQIIESLAVKTPSWAVSLVDSPQTPLIVAGELNKQRIVWVGFDVLQSTWHLRIAFPIFIANATEWLNPLSEKASQRMIRAGEPFRFPLADRLTNAPISVTMPDGSSKPLTLDPGAREVVFGDTARQGIYHLREGTNDVVFCVNLLDATESDTTPRAELQLGKYAKVTATALRRADLGWWRWFAAGGLVFLLFEWWYYHRRTA